MRYIKKYENKKQIIPFWKVYAVDQLTLGTSLNLIDPDCLSAFYGALGLMIDYDDYDYIWIYKDESDWSWDSSKVVLDPAKRYNTSNRKYEYMGEISPTKKQIEDYKFSCEVRNYNL
jgi:hypothetical protein